MRRAPLRRLRVAAKRFINARTAGATRGSSFSHFFRRHHPTRASPTSPSAPVVGSGTEDGGGGWSPGRSGGIRSGGGGTSGGTLNVTGGRPPGGRFGFAVSVGGSRVRGDGVPLPGQPFQ